MEELRMATAQRGGTNGQWPKPAKGGARLAWQWALVYTAVIFGLGALAPKLFETAGRCFGG